MYPFQLHLKVKANSLRPQLPMNNIKTLQPLGKSCGNNSFSYLVPQQFCWEGQTSSTSTFAEQNTANVKIMNVLFELLCAVQHMC